MRAYLMAAALGALTLAGPARAGVVDVSFSGTFNQYNTGCQSISPPPGTCLTTAIATPFTGVFSYTVGNGYITNGVTLTSDAFASLLKLPTVITGTDGTSLYARITQSGSTVNFTNLLDSPILGANLVNLQVVYPPSAGATLAAPLPSLGSGSGTLAFFTSQSPGGSGPSLSGVLSTFVETERVATAVPEPSGWAMMLAGTGFVGGALRRRLRARAGARAAFV